MVPCHDHISLEAPAIIVRRTGSQRTSDYVFPQHHDKETHSVCINTPRTNPRRQFPMTNQPHVSVRLTPCGQELLRRNKDLILGKGNVWLAGMVLASNEMIIP